jgi:adenylyltransferase/sulfurtransferase
VFAGEKQNVMNHRELFCADSIMMTCLLQATEVIKIILGKDKGLLVGKVLVFDALAMKFSELGVAKSSDKETISELIDYQGFCAGPKTTKASQQETVATDVTTNPTGRTMDEVQSEDTNVVPEYNTIEPIECLNKMANGWSPWVLDVRLQSENDIVKLPFTDVVVPHRTVRPDHIPVSGEILVYCKGGVRGKKACAQLVEMGVDPKRLYNLDGGILRWQKDVDPTMPRY